MWKNKGFDQDERYIENKTQEQKEILFYWILTFLQTLKITIIDGTATTIT
jgi:hypothetical protein